MCLLFLPLLLCALNKGTCPVDYDTTGLDLSYSTCTRQGTAHWKKSLDRQAVGQGGEGLQALSPPPPPGCNKSPERAQGQGERETWPPPDCLCASLDCAAQTNSPERIARGQYTTTLKVREKMRGDRSPTPHHC